MVYEKIKDSLGLQNIKHSYKTPFNTFESKPVEETLIKPKQINNQ